MSDPRLPHHAQHDTAQNLKVDGSWSWTLVRPGGIGEVLKGFSAPTIQKGFSARLGAALAMA